MKKTLITLLFLCTMNLISKELTIYLPEPTNDKEALRLRAFYDERNRIGLLFSEIVSLEDREKIYKNLAEVEYIKVTDLTEEFAEYTHKQYIWKALTSGRSKKFVEVFNIDFLMIITKSNQASEYNTAILLDVRLVDLSKGTLKLMLTVCETCNTSEGRADNIKQRLVPKKLKTTVDLLTDDESPAINTELNETLDCLERFTCNLEFAYSKWEKLDSETTQCQSALYNLAMYWKIKDDKIKSVLYFRRAIQIDYRNNEFIKRIARKAFPDEFN